MTIRAANDATYADLLALPEDVRAEILSGSIVTEPAPLPKHSKAQGALRGYIGQPFDDQDGRGGPGGWWIFLEVDIDLGPRDVVRPDLAGWRRERLRNPSDIRPFTVMPDWVCEVTSPSTASRDRTYKRDLYARSGIAHYWIVDVDLRTLEALTLHQGSWQRAGIFDVDASAARIAPFDAIALDVSLLFLPQASR